MSKKSIQKMSEKEIQQKIEILENNKKFIEAKIEKLKNKLKLESNSTIIPQKIKTLEYNKQKIETNIEKLKNRLKKLESNKFPQEIKELESNKFLQEIKKLQDDKKELENHRKNINAEIKKIKNRLKELESKVLKSTSTTTQKYFTDASQRNGKTKIAIYSPTKDIKQAKEIANCNTAQAEFLAIQWALSHANTKKEYAIIYNDNSSSIEKAKIEFKEHKNIEFLWIPRKENKIADKLARI